MDRTDILMGKKGQNFSITAEGFLGLLIVFILAVLYFTAGGINGFFSLQNIMAMMGVFSYIFIAAIGMTMIIITGNIDISFGAVVSVIAIVMAFISKISVHIPIWLFLPAGMIVGAVLCGTNAYLMTKFRIPSLVVTLATMQIYYGALMWFVEGSIYNLRSNWTWFSFDAIIGGIVPLSVVTAVILLVVSILFFRYSKFIKRLYAIGNNKQGAVYAGINVEKTMITAYIISGSLLAVSTIILATSGTRVTAMIGNNLEMKIIAAVIVGGASAMGGSGKIYGTALGSLLLTIISPALVFLDINTYWTNMFTGLIIVTAVIVSALRSYDTSMKIIKATPKREGK
jgi:ribose/xylose/arabinose/galactoside ABC-type transport system permease subunit